MCADFQPIPVSESLAYGFAIKFNGNDKTASNSDCCKCYEVEWTSGAARGKKMVVQAVTPGTAAGDVGGNDLILLVPGGGGGPYSQGCQKQYGTGYNWYALRFLLPTEYKTDWCATGFLPRSANSLATHKF